MPSNVARSRRSWLRALQRPWVTLGCMLFLVADVCVIARPPWEGASEVGGSVWFATHEFRGGPTWETRPLPVVRYTLVRDGRGLRLINPERESWDALSAVWASHPERLINVFAHAQTRRDGLWALTTERRRDMIEFNLATGPGAFTAEDARAARRLVIDALGRDGDTAGFSRARLVSLEKGNTNRKLVLPAGYLHNATAAGVLGVLVVSLAWVPRTPAAVRAQRRAGRLARGVCPGCEYPLEGLGAAKVCPECGAEWSGV